MGGGGAEVKHFGGFDTLRVFAALAVVFTHSFELTGHAGSRPLVYVGHLAIAFGEVGVWIFFTTSGFLVARSFQRSGRGASFAWNRFARIWPALVVLILLSVFVLGPAMTTVGLRNYFTSKATLLYLVKNSFMFMGPVFHLPGVFTHHQTKAVNGSLWTLPYELWAYVGVLLLGVAGLLKRRVVPIALVIVAFVLFRFGSYSPHIRVNYQVWNALSLRIGTLLGSFFLIGVVLAGVQRFDLRKLGVPCALAFLLAFPLREPMLAVLGFAGATIALGVTNARISASLRRFGDPSYGIYIYGMPIQQCLYHAGVRASWVMFAISAPLTIAAGYLSWHFVESPALKRLKRRRGAAPLPVPSGTGQPMPASAPSD